MLGIYKKPLEFPINNFFNLPDPDGYECYINRYNTDHSYMVITVLPKSELARNGIPFRLDFSTVEYFEGPVRWKGANFCVATPEECMKLLRKLEEFDPLDDETILSNFAFFTLNTSQLQIKILASQGRFVKLDKSNMY